MVESLTLSSALRMTVASISTSTVGITYPVEPENHSPLTVAKKSFFPLKASQAPLLGLAQVKVVVSGRKIENAGGQMVKREWAKNDDYLCDW